MTTTDTPRTDAMYETHTSEYQRRLLSEDLERKLHDAEIRIQAEVSRIEMLNRQLAELKAEVERLRANLRRAIEIAKVLGRPFVTDFRAYQLRAELDQLKATLSPDNK